MVAVVLEALAALKDGHTGNRTSLPQKVVWRHRPGIEVARLPEASHHIPYRTGHPLDYLFGTLDTS